MRHQIYEVTFAGEAGATVCAAFDDCEITAGPETTTVRAELPDQAAVMGLLWRITGLGLELVEMHRVATQARARNEWPPPARRGLPARGRRLALESRSGAGGSPALSTPTRGAGHACRQGRSGRSAASPGLRGRPTQRQSPTSLPCRDPGLRLSEVCARSTAVMRKAVG